MPAPARATTAAKRRATASTTAPSPSKAAPKASSNAKAIPAAPVPAPVPVPAPLPDEGPPDSPSASSSESPSASGCGPASASACASVSGPATALVSASGPASGSAQPSVSLLARPAANGAPPPSPLASSAGSSAGAGKHMPIFAAQRQTSALRVAHKSPVMIDSRAPPIAACSDASPGNSPKAAANSAEWQARMARDTLKLATLLGCLPAGTAKKTVGVAIKAPKTLQGTFKQAEQEGWQTVASKVVTAQCLTAGFGTKQDLAKAFRYYQIAAELCLKAEVVEGTLKRLNPQAVQSAGKNQSKVQTNRILLKSAGISGKKEQERFDSFRTLLALKTLPVAAYYGLGNAFYHGLGVPVSYNEAFSWLRRAASHGLAVAKFRVAEMYDLGQGHIQDYPRALAWYSAAGEETSDPAAWVRCGLMHELGVGTRVNIDGAREFYGKAASAHYFAGAVMLALMSMEPKKSSLEELALQAESGTPAAMHNYAFALLSGNYGVVADTIGARRWFRKAAAGGLAASQYMLGRMYHNYSVPEGATQLKRNLSKAAHWYREAAMRGHRGAAWQLAQFCRAGNVDGLDSSQAHVWARKARLGYCFNFGDEGVMAQFEEFVAPQYVTPPSHQMFPPAQGPTRNVSPYLTGMVRDDTQQISQYLVDPLEPYRYWTEAEFSQITQPEVYPPSSGPGPPREGMAYQTVLTFDADEIRAACTMEELKAALAPFEFRPTPQPPPASPTPSSSPVLSDATVEPSANGVFPAIFPQAFAHYKYSSTAARLETATVVFQQAREATEAGRHMDAVSLGIRAFLIGKCSGAPGGCEAKRFLAALSIQRVLATVPDHPLALYLLAVISVGRHPYERSLQICNRLVAPRGGLSKEPAAYFLRARILARLGRHSEAVLDCKTAIALYESAAATALAANGKPHPNVAAVAAAGGGAPLPSANASPTAALTEADMPITCLIPIGYIPHLGRQVRYVRAICLGNLPPTEWNLRNCVTDLEIFVSSAVPCNEQAPDAYYALSAAYLLCEKHDVPSHHLSRISAARDFYKHGLLLEARRFSFLPPVTLKAFKLRLGLELKYTCFSGVVRTMPWDLVPPELLRNIEGNEPELSITRTCAACGVVGKTLTCARCKMVRYCNGACQILHWQRGHVNECSAS